MRFTPTHVGKSLKNTAFFSAGSCTQLTFLPESEWMIGFTCRFVNCFSTLRLGRLRDQGQSFKVGQLPTAAALLAVSEPLRLGALRELEDITHCLPVGHPGPQLIPDPLARIAQEDPRPDLDQPA